MWYKFWKRRLEKKCVESTELKYILAVDRHSMSCSATKKLCRKINRLDNSVQRIYLRHLMGKERNDKNA